MPKNSSNSTKKKKQSALSVTDRRKKIVDWPDWASAFPYRLEHIEHGDKKVCWFQCEWHLNKHLERYKLNPKIARVDVYDGMYTAPKVIKKPKKQLFSTIDDFFS